MLFPVFITALLAISPIMNVSAAGVSPTHPITKSQLDAKIYQLNGRWFVMLSDNILYVIKPQDLERFNDLMEQYGGVIPPHYIALHPEDFYPYTLIFEGSGVSFHLIKQMGTMDLWVLGFGDHALYQLEEKEGASMILNHESWTLENAFRAYALDPWEIGGYVIVVEVIAISKHAMMEVGHLAFYFETQADAQEWIRGEYPGLTSGYWVVPNGN